MSQSQSKRWCFTLNNYSSDEMAALSDIDCAYMIYQPEVAPKTGTDHLQGYVIFKSNKRLSAVKKINSRMHWEVAKGSTQHNITYCSKSTDGGSGHFIELGTRPKTKAEIGEDEKQRWKDIISHAKAGTLEDHNPQMYYLHYNTNLKLQAKYEVPDAIAKNVKVYWGTTNSGKTYTAWEEAGPDAYVKDPRSKFWYGYHGQENVIIDEFRGGIDISHMLRWLDDYPCLVEIKGSSCALKAKNIWITSNVCPEYWYPELDQETMDAFKRRFTARQFTHLNKRH